MDELPPWVILQSQDEVLKGVLRELFSNAQLRGHLDGVFAPEGRAPFKAFVGDASLIDRLNKAAGEERYRLDPNTGAVAMVGTQPYGGIAVDLDKLHGAARDSAQAREMVRDALLHEFGHLVPVAQGGEPTGDPARDSDITGHPVIQNENKLRGLLGLPSKAFYGLLGKR